MTPMPLPAIAPALTSVPCCGVMTMPPKSSLKALVNPHPALKVSVPMNPMVDGWMGDDWFHNGAFREQNMPYIYEQVATRKNEEKWWTDHFDDYDVYMEGSAGDLGRSHGLD